MCEYASFNERLIKHLLIVLEFCLVGNLSGGNFAWWEICLEEILSGGKFVRILLYVQNLISNADIDVPSFVGYTAFHALEHGFRTVLIDDACRGVDQTNIDDTKQKLVDQGAIIVHSSQVLV